MSALRSKLPARRAGRATGRAARPLLVAALVLLAVMPQAADMTAGVEAYQRRDFGAALDQLLPLAEAGDARAQTILGIMHESGEGVAMDHATAAAWYRLAAEQGYDPAQYGLANLYATGRGLPRNDGEANYWYASAAAQGNAWAARRMEERAPEDAPSLVERPGRRAVDDPVLLASIGISAERLNGLMNRFPTLASAAPRTAPPPPDAREPAERLLGTLDHGPLLAMGDALRTGAPPAPVGGSVPAPLTGTTAERGGRYRVQITSARSADRAERAIERVTRALEGASAGLEPAVARADLGAPKGVWYRGQLGPLASLAEAERLCEIIIERGGAPHCFAVSAPRE